MNIKTIVIIALVLFVLYKIFDSGKSLDEKFSGALTQLVAKGPQDVYLTINNEKYLSTYPYYENWLYDYNEQYNLYRKYVDNYLNYPYDNGYEYRYAHRYPYGYGIWNMPTKLQNYIYYPSHVNYRKRYYRHRH